MGKLSTCGGEEKKNGGKSKSYEEERVTFEVLPFLFINENEKYINAIIMMEYGHMVLFI